MTAKNHINVDQRKTFSVSLLFRALRLPFLAASILPFCGGSLSASGDFDVVRFALGFVAVAATHLSGNMINDYCDSRSGADWKDISYFGLFGGSKLIQEGRLSERFYLIGAIVFGLIAAGAVVALTVIDGDWVIPAAFGAILVLAWMYSSPPLRLAYRRCGELVVFALFGPATVLGGRYLQGAGLDWQGLLLSVPFGLLTVAILVANELPDLSEDRQAGKNTIVDLTGAKYAYLLYLGLSLAAVGAVCLCVQLGLMGSSAFYFVSLLVPMCLAARIMQRSYQSKAALVRSSAIAVAVQAIGSLALIAGIVQ